MVETLEYPTETRELPEPVLISGATLKRPAGKVMLILTIEAPADIAAMATDPVATAVGRLATCAST